MAKAKAKAKVETKSEIEVRRLETLDVFRVARILNRCGVEARNELLGALFAEEDDDTPQLSAIERLEKDEFPEDRESDDDGFSLNVDMGKLLFAVAAVLDEAEEPLIKLLADLAGMKPQQLNDSPLETPIEIIIKLVQQEQENLAGFFERVGGLMNASSGDS